MRISQALREAIQRSGLTIYRIAKDCDTHSSVVARFVHGERDLRLETADRIAEYLGLELRPRRHKGTRKKK